MDEITPFQVAIFLVVALGTGWLYMIAWTAKRQVQRLDRVEKEKANEKSVSARFDSAIKQIDDHIREDKEIHRMIAAELKQTNASLVETNLTLAKIAQNGGMK